MTEPTYQIGRTVSKKHIDKLFIPVIQLNKINEALKYGVSNVTMAGSYSNDMQFRTNCYIEELNTDLPLPFYDFTARTQLPQLCLFQRPDPKASDYTWLNPFTYCAADPVNKIDPDGQILSAVSNGISYTWEFRSENGWGFYDPDGKLYDGDDTFLMNLIVSLTKLASEATGNSLITDIVNSEKNIELRNGNNIGTGATRRLNIIYIDFDDPAGAPTTNGIDFNPVIILGHELAHVQFGKITNEKWVLTKDGHSESITSVDSSELYATHIENKIRSEQKLPLRTHYLYSDGVIAGRIIDITGRFSLYYDKNEKLIFPKAKSTFIPFKY